MTSVLKGIYNKTAIVIFEKGDFTKEPSDAIIMPISSSRMWSGGADNMLRRTGGQSFYDQLAKEELTDSKTVVARGPVFRHVIFIVDDLKTSIGELVQKGLAAADAEEFATVTLPDMRVTTRNVVRKTMAELHAEMIAGAQAYIENTPTTHLRCIQFVFRE